MTPYGPESTAAKAARKLARNAKVLKLAREGLRHRDICERLGMDSGTVSVILRAAGHISPRRGDMLPMGSP